MHSRGVEIFVGFFLVCGLLAAIGLALTVSGLTFNSKEGYKVYAHFENIGGLTRKAKVAMSGVQIGTVTDISIDPESLTAVVEMEIFNEVNYLSADSSVQILTSGLLGGQYLGISVGAEDEMLQEGGIIEDTQSALVLEELIGQFLFNQVSE
ncbi:MAG: outer membrane lipid asymmetry maintenance protein MlaD [Pseudomonadales bacterium]